MIARAGALTGLEFNTEAIKANTKPNVEGAVVDFTTGILGYSITIVLTTVGFCLLSLFTMGILGTRKTQLKSISMKGSIGV